MGLGLFPPLERRTGVSLFHQQDSLGNRCLKGDCRDFQYLDHKSSWHWDWWEYVKKNTLKTSRKFNYFFSIEILLPFECPRQPNFTPFGRPRQLL